MEKKIEDLEISYLGIKIKVSHSFYKPNTKTPGRLRYTFHLPTKKVQIEHLLDSNNQFYWAEVNKGATAFATELGKAMEDSAIDSDVPAQTNILNDIEIIYNDKSIKVTHSLAPKQMNDTGNIVYTFHLGGGSITIRQYKDNEEFHWKEVPGENTEIADKLGKLLEEYYSED